MSASAALGALGLALGPGCRDATQVTVEISLAQRASCAETNGTAITVGTEPGMTQQRVADEFVTATTDSCTEATHEIGTLVVTPGGNGHGSIIVVVAYDKAIVPSSCKPPLFKGCIVARRQFTFSDHQQLHLPITIDPQCKDVPCDAFSTCRTGKCFSSDVSCNGDGCLEPGDPGDGGTSVDGQVIPDTGVVDGQLPFVDGGGDSAVDGRPTDSRPATAISDWTARPKAGPRTASTAIWPATSCVRPPRRATRVPAAAGPSAAAAARYATSRSSVHGRSPPVLLWPSAVSRWEGLPRPRGHPLRPRWRRGDPALSTAGRRDTRRRLSVTRSLYASPRER